MKTLTVVRRSDFNTTMIPPSPTRREHLRSTTKTPPNRLTSAPPTATITAMSDKKRRPVVGKLITSAATRSTTPLECKVLSPTGIINRDMGGIGLGIVAALENNIQAKNTNFSCRIPVGQTRIVGNRENREKAGSLEDEYTIVTSQKLNKSIIKVYQAQQAIELRDQSSIFDISPASCGGDDMKVSQPAGFLSSCYLCNKRLQGKDIYMYRGEKPFCSPECRNRQIAMDEKPEKYCSSQVSSSGTSHLITTVIFAT